jgi:hypothetical protein
MKKFKIIAGLTAFTLIGATVIIIITSYNSSRLALKTTTSNTTLRGPSQVIENKSPSLVIETRDDQYPPFEPKSLTPLDSYISKIKDDESIREHLYRLYGRFNGLVGNYDNYKTTSKEEWFNLLDYNFLQPEVFEKFAEVTSIPELKKDFTSVAALVNHARKGLADGIPSDDDIKALRYEYEIVNDVQIWVLPQIGDNPKVRHKFGASFALKDHKQAILIEEWIAKKP